jgi:hypothetical protein
MLEAVESEREVRLLPATVSMRLHECKSLQSPSFRYCAAWLDYRGLGNGGHTVINQTIRQDNLHLLARGHGFVQLTTAIH